MLKRFLTVDWPSEEESYEVSSLLISDSSSRFDFVNGFGFNADWLSKAAFCLSILNGNKTFSN